MSLSMVSFNSRLKGYVLNTYLNNGLSVLLVEARIYNGPQGFTALRSK